MLQILGSGLVCGILFNSPLMMEGQRMRAGCMGGGSRAGVCPSSIPQASWLCAATKL